MEENQNRFDCHDCGLPPRKLGWFCGSVAVHACLIAALIYFVRVPPPEHEWVLAYVLDPGAAADSGRNAASEGASSAQEWLLDRPLSPPEGALRIADPAPPPAIAPDSDPPPRESLAMLDLGAARLRDARNPARGGHGAGRGHGRGLDDSGKGAGSGVGSGGGNGTLAHADYGASPLPAYPGAARRRGEQGTVLLRVLVGADGAVLRAEIAHSSGFRTLDNAALTTVRTRWRFVAARRDGKAVRSSVLVPIRFALTEASTVQ